jgi:hypothetical protein
MATKKKAAKKKAAPKKKAAVARKSASFSQWSPKAMFLDSFQKEHATTMKVLRALPPGQGEFRPHPRSQCARELAFTFVIEQNLMSLTIRDQFKLGGGMPKAPSDFGMIVDQFDADYNALVELIKKSPDKAFEGTVDFPTGPGKIGAWPKMEFLYFMLRDQIHHRGQYSIYVRMAGGKVPSIYGPSGDEPWF